MAYRVLRDEASAQDAVQEAFFSLWRHRAGLVVRAAGVGPWLTVATRNAALNMARGRTRRQSREAVVTHGGVAPAGDDPFEVAAAGMAASAVRSAVGELPPEQRTVIRLAYFHGKTLAEIAAQTAAPLGTVKRRAQLALSRLAHAFGASRR